MKKFLLLSLLVAFIFGAYFLWIRERSSDVVIDTQGTVIAFGDSLTAGFGATHKKDYVTLLSEKIGRPILNAGKNGDTTQSALARLEQDVLAKDPALVIILLGGNDVLRGISKERSIHNLELIVDRIQKTQAVPVLVGLGRRAGLEEKTQELAKRKNIPYVSSVLDGIIGNPDRLSDPVHPNDDGYALIAERIYDVVQDFF